ncbi:MAG: hypothetical protein H0W76_02430 [Pyrinomonadaceae bacterium]|nr:hypothetical protein [Pyrinomonadaceae bacterium]
MSEISQEEAVKKFAQLSQPFISSPLNPRSIIDTVTAFYRDVRIAGASIDTDGDMLLLEWGTTKPQIISSFTDFRSISDIDVKVDCREFQ